MSGVYSQGSKASALPPRSHAALSPAALGTDHVERVTRYQPDLLLDAPVGMIRLTKSGLETAPLTR